MRIVLRNMLSPVCICMSMSSVLKCVFVCACTQSSGIGGRLLVFKGILDSEISGASQEQDAEARSSFTSYFQIKLALKCGDAVMSEYVTHI